MGIYDRDYMRRGTGRRDADAANRVQRQPDWVRLASIAVAVIAIGAALMLLARELSDKSKPVPFPQTGALHWYTVPSEPARAAFTVQAPENSRLNFVVRLDDWATRKPVVLIPIRPGETAKADVPLGRYRVTVIKGSDWRGPGKYFRSESQAQESVHPLEFFRVGNSTTGHWMRIEREGGERMEMQPAAR